MKKQSGFSLIELVIVIVIVGILSAFAIPKYLNITEEAKAVTLEKTFSSTVTAFELFKGKTILNGTPSLELEEGVTVKATHDGYPVFEDISALDSLIRYGHRLVVFKSSDTVDGFIVGFEGNSNPNCQIKYIPAADDTVETLLTLDVSACK